MVLLENAFYFLIVPRKSFRIRISNTLYLLSLQNDYDMVDYLNELRESILDAFTSIVQGLPEENPIVNAHLQFMLEFIKTVGRDDDSTDNTLCSCVGLIGYVFYLALSPGYQEVTVLVENEIFLRKAFWRLKK